MANCQNCGNQKKDDQYPLCYTCAMAKKGTPVVPKASFVPKPAVAKVEEVDTKSSGFSLRYSVDLAIAGKIGVNQIIDYAQVFKLWLDKGVVPGELPVPEETVN